jgi:hypothetical protein
MFTVILPAVPGSTDDAGERVEAVSASASREPGAKADSNIDFTDS